MAEGKKSFVLYADLIKSIEHLTNEEKGILLTHLLEYVNDMNPVLTDRLILTAWKPIEVQLKRDLIKFEEVKSKRSEAGKRSAELRALKSEEQNLTNSTSVESVKQSSTNPTVNDNDNVSVNDSVNVNDIINNNIYVLSCLESEQWIETICMAKKITPEQCKDKLIEFEKHLIITADQKQNKKEFQTHFSNWLIKDTSINNSKPKEYDHREHIKGI